MEATKKAYAETQEQFIPVSDGASSRYTDRESEYAEKLFKILRTKDEETQKAIMQNIDTFLRVPSDGVEKVGASKKSKKAG